MRLFKRAAGSQAPSPAKQERPSRFDEEEFHSILQAQEIQEGRLVELDLSGKYLDHKAAQELTDVLSLPANISGGLAKLNLANNFIGDNGVLILARCLEKNKSITELDLRENSLTGTCCSNSRNVNTSSLKYRE